MRRPFSLKAPPVEAGPFIIHSFVNAMTQTTTAVMESANGHNCPHLIGKFCTICSRKERWQNFLQRMAMVHYRTEHPQADYRVLAAIAGRMPEDDPKT